MQGAENGQEILLVVHVCLNVSISVFIIVRATKFGIKKVYLLQQEFISNLGCHSQLYVNQKFAHIKRSICAITFCSTIHIISYYMNLCFIFELFF